MNNLMQHLSLILPVIATSCVFIIVGINLYLRFRRSFPVRVNCWFCKEWTKVHYDNRNNFECPTCLQYNGFTSDGDYNKIIPAQHDELLNNHYSHAHKKTDKVISNGLCRICNNNQQLKIYQLANFVPLNEDDFDTEVEAFRQQLEKAYKLCPVCEHIVKKTIAKQNKWLLGLKLIGSKVTSLPLIDLKKKSGKAHFLSFLNASIVIFAFLIIVNAVYNFVSPSLILNKIIEKYVFPYSSAVIEPLEYFYRKFLNSNNFKILQDKYANFFSIYSIDSEYLVNVIKPITKYFPFHLFPNGLEAKHLFGAGLLFQIIASCSSAEKMSVKRLQIAYWILLSATIFLQSSKYTIFINFVQIITSIGILHLSLLGGKSPTENKTPILTRKANSPRNKQYTSKLPRTFESNRRSLDSTFQSTCDTDTANSDCSLDESDHSISTKKKINYLNGAACNKTTNHIFGQAAIFENALMKKPISFEELNTTKSVRNESFATARSSMSLYRDNSFPTKLGKNFDLNKSLNNLHLSSWSVCHQMQHGYVYTVNKDVTRPRPILSPPKLKTVNQNSWTAGGFWKHPQMYNVLTNTNLSRSSSQSSGYVSQYNEPLHIEVNKFNSLPSSRNNSLYENHERFSLISEPAYHYSLLQPQYPDPRNLSRPSIFLNNVNNASTKNNMVYRYAKPNNYPDVSLNSLNYDKLKNFNLNSAASINQFNNREQVRSPFYPFTTSPNLEENQSNYYKPTLTANLMGNQFCSNATNNLGININSTYKTGSLLKPLNETFCNS